MPAVMAELTRKAEPVVTDPEEVTLVADVEALVIGTVPGCNDDNPYQ